MDATCPKCGAVMEKGHVKGSGGESKGKGLFPPEFVIPGGKPASWNPLKSFAQGLADEPGNRGFRIAGARCSKCGYLELFAIEEVAV